MRGRFIAAFFLCLSGYISPIAKTAQTPRLTLVIIIDQFAYNYLYKLRPHLKGGIGFLLRNGTVYENAHFPHAMPETGPGHATLHTGTVPKDHGIIANSWFENGKEIKCDEDAADRAGVFGPHNDLQPYGASGHLMMVDGLSDQFMLQNQEESPHVALSLSLKSRSATLTAGSLGKAIWFDTKNGMFTSSQAYFEKLPEWLTTFNSQAQEALAHGCFWNLAYPKKPKAYKFYDTQSYTWAEYPTSLLEKNVPIQNTQGEPYADFTHTPCASQLLVDLAQAAINQYCTDKNNRTLLWLSLSSLDLLAHDFGPNSKDAIDMVYHIDKQIEHLITHVHRTVGKHNALIVLTADHGIMPIQGILKEHRLKHVYRHQARDIIEQQNSAIAQKFGIENVIQEYQAPTMYLNNHALAAVDAATKATIIDELKRLLKLVPGIKNVWTLGELETLCFTKAQEFESYFKNQIYAGRSGEIVIQPQPYTLLAKHEKGTTHETPYNYDTHVPLIFYYPPRIQKKKVVKKVYMTQVANTLAQLIHVPKPSASPADVLPGIFKHHP